MKQYSEACDQNRDPILSVIRREFANCRRILEIGSGTGQHAVYFARQLPHLAWQPSDIASSHASINAWTKRLGGDALHRRYGRLGPIYRHGTDQRRCGAGDDRSAPGRNCLTRTGPSDRWPATPDRGRC